MELFHLLLGISADEMFRDVSAKDNPKARIETDESGYSSFRNLLKPDKAKNELAKARYCVILIAAGTGFSCLGRLYRL
jgi:hypothetical protein